jgi:hypothetical protein
MNLITNPFDAASFLYCGATHVKEKSAGKSPADFFAARAGRGASQYLR